MNERIKELMRESGVKTLFPGDPGAGCPGPKGVSAGLSESEKLEKFAELIVRECAEYAEHELDVAGYKKKFMLKHFGVEE
jgi:hypothetical protein